MTVTLIHPERRARAIGAEHGKSAAGWAEIDSTNAIHLLRAIDDCELFDVLDVRNPLSGEFADDYSTSELLRECGVEFRADNPSYSDFITDRVATVFESAYFDAFADEIGRRARYQVTGIHETV